MKKMQNKSTSSGSMLSTTNTTTNSEGHESNILKRKYTEVTSQQHQQQQPSEGMVVWNDALQQIENTMDLKPKLKYIPHVPLMEVSVMLFCSVGKG